MLINSIVTKKYKGAYIHIINYFQQFVVVVFYKGRFYQFLSVTDKAREYTNEEYILVLNGIYEDAKKFIESIKVQRSLKFRIKGYLIKYVKRQRKTSRIPQDPGQVRGRQKSPTQELKV